MITFQAHRKQVESVVFSPGGELLATAGAEDGVRVWQVPDAEPRHKLIACGSYPQLTFSPDGRSLACAGAAGAWVWSFDKQDQAFIAKASGSSRCAFTPDGRTFAVQTMHSPLRRWRTAGWEELSPHWGRPVPTGYYGSRPTHPFAYQPGGLVALVCDLFDQAEAEWRCDIVLHDAESGEERGKVRVAQSQPKLAFSPDGRVLAAVVNTQLRVWSVPGLEELAVRRVGRKHFQDLAFTPDGARLVTVSNDETVRMWDTATWNEVGGYEWKIGKLVCVAVTADGMRMAAGGSTGTVVIWDVD